MYRRAVTAATTTAAALLLAAGPAVADDDFAGPHRTSCGHHEPRLLDVIVPLFAEARRASCALADTDEPAWANQWDEPESGWAPAPWVSFPDW
ncbi:hypothetical protein [Nonomuraea jiangxiensis]|uniref:Secreted protein n=1 Tax=Nonomuraea jiangxiensis TaxID=633440 RepID=A0A1G8BN13_9ACTN|nr:hypothetical protein [Nonomuraea jiangxiensis]SDH34617.1 hypothetical protein SAMN05421869_10276 [Nonomuraea jiangxiensis]